MLPLDLLPFPDAHSGSWIRIGVVAGVEIVLLLSIYLVFYCKSKDELVLQVPARTLLEGDTVTLYCQGRWNSTVTKVQFYWDENNLTGSINVTELSLSPLQLNHSGCYSCRDLVESFISRSAAVTVTMHGPQWMSPSPAPPQDPQVTNVELSAPYKGQWDSRDYDGML
ncbi:low affinity immunoglobulin gamma Fc region receptor II-like [Passer domesticus]|uniref:low affinity immunoglobulin gamma Fc region receptor II-like n=1 Tax=Passer domesticus TaxID=48849 RepID=UPI0030FE41C3